MGAMHLWTDDEEFVIAEDEADAIRVMQEQGYDADVFEMRLYPDDKPFTFHDREAVTKPAGEWARERGRGYFGSANY